MLYRSVLAALLCLCSQQAMAMSLVELRDVMIDPKGALIQQTLAAIERDVKAGQKAYFAMSEVSLHLEGQQIKDAEFENLLKDHFLSALTAKGYFQEQQGEAGELLVEYEETIPADKMWFQSNRIEATMHVTVKLHAEHHFTSNSIVLKDRSPETIALRLAIFVLSSFLLLFIGRQSGMIYDFGFRAVTTVFLLLLAALSLGGLA